MPGSREAGMPVTPRLPFRDSGLPGIRPTAGPPDRLRGPSGSRALPARGPGCGYDRELAAHVLGEVEPAFEGEGARPREGDGDGDGRGGLDVGVDVLAADPEVVELATLVAERQGQPLARPAAQDRRLEVVLAQLHDGRALGRD